MALKPVQIKWTCSRCDASIIVKAIPKSGELDGNPCYVPEGFFWHCVGKNEEILCGIHQQEWENDYFKKHPDSIWTA